MLRLIARRMLMMPLLMLGVVTIAFALSHFTKANPLSSVLSARQMGNAEVVAAAKARWGLDRSLPEQYASYVGNLVTGNMGVSFRTNRPVATDIRDRLPATLELVVAAMILGTVVGIALGVLAAHGRSKVELIVDEPLSAFGDWLADRWDPRRTGSSISLNSSAASFSAEPDAERAGYLSAQDRAFVHLAAPGDRADGSLAKVRAVLVGLEESGHAVFTIQWRDPRCIGQEFLRWEMAAEAAALAHAAATRRRVRAA